MTLTMSPSQTVGPYFAIGLAWANRSELFSDSTAPRIQIEGVLRDGDGVPIGDAVFDLWQADPEGRFVTDDGAAPGYGRISTAPDGAFRFSTVLPGPVSGPGDVPMAPHIGIQIAMRGLLKPVKTRLVFPDTPSLARCPILQLVPHARRATLIARPSGAHALRWDVHMQGPNETVFFAY
jgi:protocatechuate 3,4-dioxygenase, alpha subunit